MEERTSLPSIWPLSRQPSLCYEVLSSGGLVVAMRGPMLLFQIALVVVAVPFAFGDNLPPQWGIVSFSEVSEFAQVAGGTWVQVPSAIINGTVLVPGPANLQKDWDACATSCAATPQCNAFNFCSNGPSCIADPTGQRVPQGACQLLYQEEAAQGRGVTQLAGGNAQLSDAGVKMLIEQPTSIPEGYDMVYGESMMYGYDMPCNGSWNNAQGQCLLTSPLQDLVELCNSWEQCQMIVVGPKGWGTYAMPYGWLKGWGNSSTGWAPIDLRKGNLNPTTYLLIKKGQALGSVPAGGSGGGELSAGAVAGIAVAATMAFFLVAGGVFFILRRSRQRQQLRTMENEDVESASTSGAGRGAHLSAASKALSVGGSSQMDEVVAAFSGAKEGSGNSGDTEKLVARLLAYAPSPQWAEVIVPRQQVQFVLKDGKPVRLGTGTSGTVYRGLLNSASPCAVKVFDFQDNEKLAKYFIQEAVVLRRLRHPNVIQFLGVSVTEGRGLLLMELMAGDLWKAMRSDTEKEGGRCYSWYKRGRLVALQIASGLMYLHSQHLIHLDLKPQNVLLARDGTARIGDVGFTRMLHTTHISSLDGRIGTFTWCAPEVLLGGRATQQADIYSLGIIIWELCTGEQPVRGCMVPLCCPEQCPPEVARLQLACVQQDPASRPSAEEVVQALKALSSSVVAAGSVVLEAPASAPPALAGPVTRTPSEGGAAVAGGGLLAASMPDAVTPAPPPCDGSAAGAAWGSRAGLGTAQGPVPCATALGPGNTQAEPAGHLMQAPQKQQQGVGAKWQPTEPIDGRQPGPLHSPSSTPAHHDEASAQVRQELVEGSSSESAVGWEAEAAYASQRPLRVVQMGYQEPVARSPFAALD